MVNIKTAFSILCLTLIILPFQNCSGGEDIGTFSSFVEPTCDLENTANNSCLFYKNPYVTRHKEDGTVFSEGLTFLTDLSGYQTLGVVIDGYDTSGKLGNSSLVVYVSLDGDNADLVNSVSTTNTEFFRASTSADSKKEVSQLMGYYYSMQMLDYMKTNAGGFYAEDKGIILMSYISGMDDAYFSSAANMIVLGETQAGNQYGLAAGVVVHELGHANLKYGGNIDNVKAGTTDQDMVCTMNTAICCASKQGCIGAINEGQADYHAALLFQDYPAVGESIQGDMDGMAICGVTRNVELNVSLDADDVFNYTGLPGSDPYYSACQSVLGEVHSMGAVYSAIWWNARKAVIVAELDVGDFDTLFSEHLSQLHKGSDFKNSFEAADIIDQADFAGAFGTILRTAFTNFNVTLDP